MNSTKYLLIGGGLASGEAAKQLREKDSQGTITLVGEEPYAPYDRPFLSKEFLQGKKSHNDLMFHPESFYEEQRISLKLNTAVQKLDVQSKTVNLSNGEQLKFEKAFIGTVGRPIRLTIPGAGLPGVHYLRTIDDSWLIASQAGAEKRVVIIGAGFIGIEVAASLTQRGMHVTLLEAQPRIWSRFADVKLAEFIEGYCTEKGIQILTSETVTEVHGTDGMSAVITQSGKELPCDVVCIGVGIVPNVELAAQAGLKVENGILVNEYLQTSHPDIYAGGDVANYPDPLFGKRRRVEHWGHAEYCGQLAGENMAGGQKAYDLLTYVWSDIFDLHLEFAGDESEHDQMLLRGQIEENSFFILYLKNHILTAYFAINTGAKEFTPLQKLIRLKKDLTDKEPLLQDPKTPIKTLL